MNVLLLIKSVLIAAALMIPLCVCVLSVMSLWESKDDEIQQDNKRISETEFIYQRRNAGQEDNAKRYRFTVKHPTVRSVQKVKRTN